MAVAENSSAQAETDRAAVEDNDSSETGVRRLVVGLGNPGVQYARTRHNYGFFVIDVLTQRLGLKATDLCSSDFYQGSTAQAVDLAKPQTFMNRSGLAVRCLAQRFGYEPANVLVIYDDVSLPLGRQRLRPKGSPGGHRGLESVIENLRTDRVPRLRLGIAEEAEEAENGMQLDTTPADRLVEFVLEPFTKSEESRVSACVEWAADACEAWLRYGIDHTMNRFNGSLPSS